MLHFSLQYQNIFQQTGDENIENHTLGDIVLISRDRHHLHLNFTLYYQYIVKQSRNENIQKKVINWWYCLDVPPSYQNWHCKSFLVMIKEN